MEYSQDNDKVEKMNDTIILTAELIEDGYSVNGGINKKQAEILGVGWPLYKGWKQDIINKQIEKEKYKKYLAEKDSHLSFVNNKPEIVPDGYIRLTKELIEAGATDPITCNGYTTLQQQILGVSTPAPKGWKKTLYGTVVPEADYKAFLKASNRNNK